MCEIDIKKVMLWKPFKNCNWTKKKKKKTHDQKWKRVNYETDALDYDIDLSVDWFSFIEWCKTVFV